MLAVVSPQQIDLSLGVLVRLPGTWTDYQALVDRLGDRARQRLKYRSLEYVVFTPITLSLPEVSGVEPDYCFYIEHCAAITGKDRIDWGVDPAPDLVNGIPDQPLPN
jgi:Uma2 family endonuclease